MIGSSLPSRLGATPIDELQISFQTASPFWIVTPGHEQEAFFLAQNPTSAPVQGVFQVRIGSYAEPDKVVSRPFVLAPKAEAHWTLPAAALGRVGIKYLHAELRGDDSTRRLTPHQFAYMVPVGNDPALRTQGFLFSMAGIRAKDDADLDRQLHAAAMIGVEVWRDSISWSQVEPRPDQWHWAKSDQELAIATRHGIERQVILTQTPKWALSARYADATDLKKPATYPGKLEEWRRYVRAVATRYDGKIRFWEVWNEPDLKSFFRGTTEEYVALLKAGYSELKSVSPDNVVMTGGFARAVPRPGDTEGRGDLQRDAIAQAQGFFDVHAFHRHGMFPDFQRDVDGPEAEIRAQMRDPKPYWFDETAMHSTLIGEREQARTLFKKLGFAWARGSIGYTWFNLVERDSYPVGNAERYYGAMLADLEPKAVYVAYNELVRQLRGKHFTQSLDLGAGRWAFQFDGPDGTVIMAWRETTDGGDDLWALRVPPGATAARVDLMGGEESRHTVDGVAFFPVTAEPAFWVFRGGSPTLDGRAITPLKPNASLPSGNSDIALWNPTQRPLRIAVGDHVIALSPAAKSKTSVPAGAEIDYAIAAAGVQGNLALPVDSVVRIPAGPAAKRPPDIVLDQPEQVTNVYEHDPSRVALNWKGPADLSAKLWLSLNPAKKIVVNADVTDDAIRPVETEQAEADRLRLVFQPLDRSYTRTVEVAINAKGQPLVTQGVGATAPTETVVSAAESQITDHGIRYRLTIDPAALGFNDADLFEHGIGFNVLVQDCDTTVIESYLQWKPGAVANTAGGQVIFPR